MRIGAISDLHIDRHPKLKSNVYLETLIKVVQHREIDLLLIAGDISNYFRDSYQFIKDLKTALHIAILFVPGNHDYWKAEDGTTSQAIYDFYRTKPECL
ncbi:MAG: metallophosphoesterase, partial [Staphylococcus sp.]|nr:metallophosphoesterase [Staphylococcus sp.]